MWSLISTRNFHHGNVHNVTNKMEELGSFLGLCCHWLIKGNEPGMIEFTWYKSPVHSPHHQTIFQVLWEYFFEYSKSHFGYNVALQTNPSHPVHQHVQHNVHSSGSTTTRLATPVSGHHLPWCVLPLWCLHPGRPLHGRVLPHLWTWLRPSLSSHRPGLLLLRLPLPEDMQWAASKLPPCSVVQCWLPVPSWYCSGSAGKCLRLSWPMHWPK